MKIGFLITTCNRQASCHKIVDSLQGKGDIYVVNDGCDYVISGAKQLFLKGYHGRRYYWQVVNHLFSMVKNHKYDYYFMIPDDWMPSDDMVERSIEAWESINDESKICLNILCPGHEGNSNWTGYPTRDLGHVFKTQWVDMCFICEGKFFDVVGILPQVKHRRSSGVGAYISKKLFKLKYSLYQVKNEVLFTPLPEHSESQMQKT